MLRFVLAGLILLFSFVGAEARTRHHVVSNCIETNSIMSPCQNWFSLFQQPEKIVVKKVAKRHPAKRRTTTRPSVVAHHDSDHVEHIVSAGNGVVKAASGAVAYVAKSATGAFQCVVNSLEKVGYPVRFMGGFANSGHIRHSLHYVGLALDINQVGRNETKPAMPSNEIEIANACGLISGRQWSRSPDSGHFQFGGWAGKGTEHHHTKHRHRRRHRH
jgi:D-alanyl-D-alanine carboxypeptidase